MITTLSAMRIDGFKGLIIGALTLLLISGLQGCGALRLTYNNGAQLTWWWLDGYADFASEQAPAARQAIDRWFEWHRGTQLDGYAKLLAAAQGQIEEPTTPALACQWSDRVREALDPALERAIADMADLVPGLREPQFRHMEQRFGKILDEMRTDYMQSDPQVRQREALKRTLDRVERLYGSVDAQQRRRIDAAVAASPFNPELWVAERQRRQHDTVQTLRRLVAERADRDQRIAALRVLVQRSEESPDRAYRAYQEKLHDYNCGLAAQIHNGMTPAQRRNARETLKGWEEDVRALLTPVN
jgi:hypothetical protein